MSDRNADPSQLPGAEERAMLRRSIRDLLATHWPPERMVELSNRPANMAAIWKQFAELGVTTLGTSAAEGGLSEIAVVMEELGRASCPAPMLGAAVTNLALHASTGGNGKASALMSSLQAGTCLPSIAFTDLDPASSDLRFNHGNVNGTLRFVDGSPVTTHLIAIRSSDLVLIDCRTVATTVAPTRALGGGWLCQFDFIEAEASLFDAPQNMLRYLDLVARLMLLARAHGAARRSFE